MRPTNLIASFNKLFVGGGAGKEMRSSVNSHTSRGDNELIEEWPCRDMRRSSKKPPSSIDMNVNYTVPLRQDDSGDRARRRFTSRQQHRSHATSLTREDHDESSCATTADSSLCKSLNSVDFSCYSLNDMPSIGTTAHSTASRNSINTAPGLSRTGVRRGINSSTRALRRRSGTISPKASGKKSVRFTEEAPSLHSYVPIAPNTHYTAADDDYFREYTLTMARGVIRLLRTEAVRDESFDTLTGLPSAHCLRRFLNHPDVPADEVVGIEDLLADCGVTKARKRLKTSQAKKLLAEQARQLQLGVNDPKLLARSLRKTSSISSNIARCRAAYALAIED